MTPELLRAATGCTGAAAYEFAKPIEAAMTRGAINTPERIAAFVAQMAHETQLFTQMRENLYYSDAARLAKMFRRAFDRDHDGEISQAEIDFARQYTRQPEKTGNYIYSNRLGNGPEASGDGYAFRGGGLPQLTGRESYSLFGMYLGEPLLAHPDLIAQPAYAALAGAWYWNRIGANGLADQGRFDDITRRINPAMVGRDERAALNRRALVAMKVNA